jgi:hypothetical protein
VLYRYLSVFILFVSFSLPSFGDTMDLDGYIQGFDMADILGKAEILNTAASNNNLGASAAQLYEHALRYVLDNYSRQGGSDMNNIISICINNLRDAGLSCDLNLMWELFQRYPDPEMKAEILIAVGELGKGNYNIINKVNNYLVETTALYTSGGSVNYTLVSACISAVMELKDRSSYNVLFSVLRAGYPEVIASEAYGALNYIHGNLRQFLSGIIMNNPPADKYAAFKAGINSEILNISDRGYLAEIALDQALAAVNEDNADLANMRYSAVLALTNLRWTRANPLAIRHYYRVFTDFLQDTVTKDRLIEAIACLGAVGNSDAALVLGLQLGLINARVESSGSYDAEITLAIVQALGQIGDNAAFDHLLYASNLSYTENIMTAAREAISRLKW